MGGWYFSHWLNRIQSNVNVSIDNKSKIYLKRGVLIASNSAISATGGGILYLGKNVGVNRNSMIICHERITIDDNTIMGPGVCIYDHDHVFDSENGVQRNQYVTAPILIGKNCWIGADVVILRGSIIGDNCLIAAGSVVKGKVPSGSVIIQKREMIVKRR